PSSPLLQKSYLLPNFIFFSSSTDPHHHQWRPAFGRSHQRHSPDDRRRVKSSF
ncbi:hypothetical protein LINPERPRIM_LOCUS34038, partial [Linum perenne]